MNRRTFIPMLGTAIIGASCLSVNDTSREDLVNASKKRAKRLRRGDTIGIAASAGPIRHESEVREFQKVLHDMGFKTRLGKNVFDKHGYFSANDEDRAEEFMEFITDDSIDAIFFTRGGWGCARILEFLDFEQIGQHPKIIMGFSDITTLLNAISAKTGLITFHGPGGNSTWNPYSVNYIKRLLIQAEAVTYRNDPKEDAPIIVYRSGKASGDFYGGNLSVISGLIGSEYLPDWTGKILFLEDVSEEPYRIDRMLTHLKLAGVFDQVNGVVLGNFRKCSPEEPGRSFTLEEVFQQHFSEAKVPVFYGAQIGHIRNKYTVPVGAQVEMDAETGTIDVLAPTVIS